MLDQSSQDAVMSIVQEWVGSNQMFTNYDVTKHVRGTLGKYVPHYEPDGVQEFVNDLWLNSDIVFGDEYCRDLAKIPNGKSAFVYHHIDDNANDYDPNKQLPQVSAPIAVPAPVVVAPLVPASNTGTVPTPFDPDFAIVLCDKRMRLGVPAKKMRAIGAKPGDIVTVFPYKDATANKNMLIVSMGNVAAGVSGAKTYVVARDGEVRIGDKVLDLISYKTTFSISVDSSTDEVLITEA